MKTSIAAAAAVTLIASQAAHAQGAVQWKVSDGGNGHWYAVVQTAMPWQSAYGSAISSGGHLMTASSLSEYDFAKQLCVATGVSWVWLGGLQSTSTPTYREPDGGWIWIDGSPVIVAPWGVGEPNNDNQQDYLRFSIAGFVDDLQAEAPTPYLIEWSADCNNDGIVDYGQILDGTFPDSNSNGIPDCCEGGGSCCVGDILADRVINGADLGALLAYWGPVTTSPISRACDLNGDNVVNGADIGLLLSGWGNCP